MHRRRYVVDGDFSLSYTGDTDDAPNLRFRRITMGETIQLDGVLPDGTTFFIDDKGVRGQAAMCLDILVLTRVLIP